MISLVSFVAFSRYYTTLTQENERLPFHFLNIVGISVKQVSY